MAYGDDIDALGCDHRWSFDNTYNDQVGSANGTNTGTSFTTNPICEGVTYCMLSDAVGDRVSLPTTTNINNSAQNRKAVAGWFMPLDIQRPPKNIYGEGNTTTAFRFIMGWGNNVIFEVDDANFTLQIYSDTYLENNRAYHLCMIFEGNGYGNELRAYLDGVEQTTAQPTDRQPDYATLAARTVGEFSDPAGTVAVGGVEIVLNGIDDGRYNEWATWDGANAVLTDTEVREELFEKGALPDNTISTDTEANMQTALNALGTGERDNAPLCIRVEPVSGGGDLDLSANNITFNEYASIHVQYTGTDTLTWTNSNGSDASIGSTPNGGTIIFVTPVTVTVHVLDASTFTDVEGAQVLVEAASGGDLTEGTDILTGATNSSGIVTTSTFGYTNDQPVKGRVRKGTASPFYKTSVLAGTITSAGLSVTVLVEPDNVAE
jgi:hypothetical protein